MVPPADPSWEVKPAERGFEQDVAWRVADQPLEAAGQKPRALTASHVDGFGACSDLRNDPATGDELYSSGDEVDRWNHDETSRKNLHQHVGCKAFRLRSKERAGETPDGMRRPRRTNGYQHPRPSGTRQCLSHRAAATTPDLARFGEKVVPGLGGEQRYVAALIVERSTPVLFACDQILF